MHIYVHIQRHTPVHTHIYTDTHAHTHSYMHTHTHTHTHAHMHMDTDTGGLPRIPISCWRLGSKLEQTDGLHPIILDTLDWWESKSEQGM